MKLLEEYNVVDVVFASGAEFGPETVLLAVPEDIEELDVVEEDSESQPVVQVAVGEAVDEPAVVLVAFGESVVLEAEGLAGLVEA